MNISPYIFWRINKDVIQERILQLVLLELRVSMFEFKSRSRRQSIVTARQLFAYLCKKYAKTREKEIGVIINRSRTDVYHLLKISENLVKTKDIHFCGYLEILERQIKYK